MATLETPKIASGRGQLSWISADAWQQICDYGPTFATEFTVMASQIVAYKLAAHFLGKQGFSEYALARRAISTIYPIALLGFAVGLPRYIAISTGHENAERRDRFFGATLCCVGTAAAALIALMNLMPAKFAYLAYGSVSYKALALPVSLIIGGLTLHAVVYSYFRGHRLMTRANILQFTNLAVVPVLGFSIASDEVRSVLLAIGLLTIVVSSLGLLFTPWQQMAANSLAEAKMLLRYSVPRVPGDFALMALLGLPAFLVAHQAGVQAAGYVAFGVSVLSMIGAVFAPVGLILLPKSSQMIASGAGEELRGHVMRIITLALVIALGLTALAYLTADPFVRLYLGTDYSGVAKILRVICLGAVPFALFQVTRNLLDAFHELAVTSAFLIISLCVFGVGVLSLRSMSNSTAGILISLLAAILVLGLLTLLESFRILRRLRSA
ncbi:MAG: lipopolysaccharide biosynthesis protein [Candidatus Acidiferrum sp.]